MRSRRFTQRQWVSVIAGGCTGAVLGLAVLNGAVTLSVPSVWHVVLWSIVVALGYWLGVLAHELGHALAARRLGIGIKQFGIGPVTVEWSSGMPKWRRSPLHRMASGYVLMETGEVSSADYIRTHRWVLGAGPAAEALFAFVMILVAGFVPGVAWLHAGLIVAAGLHLALAMVNLIPARMGPVRTDGLQLVALLRGGPPAHAIATAGRWVDFLTSPATPGSWPEEIVAEQERALLPREGLSTDEIELALTAGYLLYLHYADRHEWIEANHVIARAVELPRPEHSPRTGSAYDLVDTIYAIHLALRGGNAFGARSTIERIPARSFIRRNTLFWGALGSVALVEGDRARAIELAIKARKRLASSLEYAGADRLEDSWWRELVERASALAMPGPVLITNAQAEAAPVAEIWFERSWREDRFSWDPGCTPELRAIWLWRVTVAPSR